MFMRKTIIAVCLVLLTSFNVFASDADYIHPFRLSPVNDSILLGTGTLLSGSALFCDSVLKMKEAELDESKLIKGDIMTFDQIFMRPYSKTLHMVGSGAVALSMATPLIFYGLQKDELINVGVMYAETLLIANGIKEWLKIKVDRARPYMYFDDYPQDKVDDGDWNCSFPSGHTTMAFACAAFTSYVYNLYYPESKSRFAVLGATFGLAAVTGGLRMASGNHYFSDVFAGAVIGTICGFVVPYMHTELFYKQFKKSETTNISASPLGFNFQIKF